MKLISGSPGESQWWDKIDSKFKDWNEENFIYELIDDLSPIENDKFKLAKDKIDKEFPNYSHLY